jgi:hypothetical protein
MDIRAGIITAVVLSVIGSLWILRSGIRTLMAARRLTFYRIRRQRERGGWYTLGVGLLLLGASVALAMYGEPVAYQYFPPSPTITLTPTITLSPTITLTPTITVPPTITNTPSVSDTPTVTSTPFIPLAIEVLFESQVTPNPAAVFSRIQFTRNCSNFNEFEAATVFQNPITYMCGVFSYDQMTPGSQWTALWWRDGKLVHYESFPWDGEVGGLGFTEWEAPASEWLPGNYEVQIFSGLNWKVVDRFILEGDAPTPLPTSTLPPTSTPSRTPTATTTFTPTRTPTRTLTPTPSQTPGVTATP